MFSFSENTVFDNNDYIDYDSIVIDIYNDDVNDYNFDNDIQDYVIECDIVEEENDKNNKCINIILS